MAKEILMRAMIALAAMPLCVIYLEGASQEIRLPRSIESSYDRGVWTMGRGFAMASKKDRRTDLTDAVLDGERRQGRDRRQFERVLVDLEVDYRCEDTFLFAYITDISLMGIFIQTKAPEPEGTRLNLRLADLELEGMVIWVNAYRPGDRENLNPGMGVKFVDLLPEQRERLTQLVKTFAYLDGDTVELGEAELDTTPDDTSGTPKA
jgi:type IV pilus assembly protein PilZ